MYNQYYQNILQLCGRINHKCTGIYIYSLKQTIVLGIGYNINDAMCGRTALNTRLSYLRQFTTPQNILYEYEYTAQYFYFLKRKTTETYIPILLGYMYNFKSYIFLFFTIHQCALQSGSLQIVLLYLFMRYSFFTTVRDITTIFQSHNL